MFEGIVLEFILNCCSKLEIVLSNWIFGLRVFKVALGGSFWNDIPNGLSETSVSMKFSKTASVSLFWNKLEDEVDDGRIE